VVGRRPSLAHAARLIRTLTDRPASPARGTKASKQRSSWTRIAMARRLAREEGLFAGTSSGANIVASRRVAERLGTNATVVTILCDSGVRYLSTDLYRDK